MGGMSPLSTGGGRTHRHKGTVTSGCALAKHHLQWDLPGRGLMGRRGDLAPHLAPGVGLRMLFLSSSTGTGAAMGQATRAMEKRWHRHPSPGLPAGMGALVGCRAWLCLLAPARRAGRDAQQSIFSLVLCLQPRRYLPAALSLISCCSEQRWRLPLPHLGWERWKTGRKGADYPCPHHPTVLPSPRCWHQLLHRSTGRIWAAALRLQITFYGSADGGRKNVPDLLSTSSIRSERELWEMAAGRGRAVSLQLSHTLTFGM